MARNKDIASKMRRGKKIKQNRSIPNWIIMKTDGRVRSSPNNRREWRNRKLKKD
ncbi:MAG: 50S ribosomal protein L39e [Candidatus Lokiarchaeota archaeon]|nr:50S ribosomal protein L39e [Candidatus Lokiarchaeota archaeon]MBD3199940.1 50S ribosomal protein L39e [Candidatus Lokiarchaeota archaeon]